MPRKTLRPDEIGKLADEKGISQDRVVDKWGNLFGVRIKEDEALTKEPAFSKIFILKIV